MTTQTDKTGTINSNVTLTVRATRGIIRTVGSEDKPQAAMYRLMARYMAATGSTDIRSTMGVCAMFAWGRTHAMDLMNTMDVR